MVWGHALRATALRAAGAAVGMALALAACGGGQQVERFVPTRIISFGDESSMIVDSGDHNGLKYTVNGFSTTDATKLDCRINPVWNQILAVNYSLVFPQCNPDAVAVTTPSEIDAEPNATVAMVADQITRFLAKPDTFGPKDLVTIMAGANDVLAAYNQVASGAISEDEAAAAMEATGIALAQQVNRVAEAGGKVIVTTIPDLGTTPFGVAEETATPGRGALLTRLTARFNSRLRVNLINDGHMIGLVLADETFTGIVKNPGINGYVNVTLGVCRADAAPPACNTGTLITPTDGTTASGDTWLWADSLHLSAVGQRTLGALALQRATGNPF